jgi:hypothetical protein
MIVMVLMRVMRWCDDVMMVMTVMMWCDNVTTRWCLRWCAGVMTADVMIHRIIVTSSHFPITSSQSSPHHTSTSSQWSSHHHSLRQWSSHEGITRINIVHHRGCPRNALSFSPSPSQILKRIRHFDQFESFALVLQKPTVFAQFWPWRIFAYFLRFRIMEMATLRGLNEFLFRMTADSTSLPIRVTRTTWPKSRPFTWVDQLPQLAETDVNLVMTRSVFLSSPLC